MLLPRGKANADQLVQEGIGRVLEVLSNTAVRRVFAYEMDNMNKPITAPYVAKKCDISPYDAALALEMLTEIHVNHLTEVMLDENNSVRMYALNSDECIMYMLMILKTARLIDENKQHYYNYRGSYNNLNLFLYFHYPSIDPSFNGCFSIMPSPPTTFACLPLIYR